MKGRWMRLVFLASAVMIVADIPVRTPERAAVSLETLTDAEADFRACDRDWNHVNDFWAPSIRELYAMTSAAIQGDEAVPLIELPAPSADESHGCHVNDSWSADVKGLFPMTTFTAVETISEESKRESP